MNSKALCLLLLLLLVIHVPSFASFPVSNVATPAHANAISSLLQHAAPEKVRSINGSLSLIFGVAGLAMCFWGGGILFGIPAIVLGSAGVRNKEEYAHAGLKLGLVSLIISAIIAILVVVLIFSLGGF